MSETYFNRIFFHNLWYGLISVMLWPLKGMLRPFMKCFGWWYFCVFFMTTISLPTGRCIGNLLDCFLQDKEAHSQYKGQFVLRSIKSIKQTLNNFNYTIIFWFTFWWKWESISVIYSYQSTGLGFEARFISCALPVLLKTFIVHTNSDDLLPSEDSQMQFLFCTD